MEGKTSRRTSLITSTVFSLLSWFLPIVIGFVATPLIVRKLGNRDYGLYAILLGFISYSFTFGIGRVLMKYVAEYRASGDNDKIGEVVAATFWFSFAIAAVGITIVAFTARIIVSDVLTLPPDQAQVGETGLYIACAAIIVTMLSQIFQFILQGLHRFGDYLLLTNISGVLLNAGNVTFAYMGYGVPTLLIWNLVSVSAMAVAFGVDARAHLPEFSLRPVFRNKQWPSVLRYGTNIILYQVSGNVLLAFERAWIVRNFGSEAATFYIVPMNLAIYLHGIVSSFTLVVFPLVNELLLDRDRLIALYEKATKMATALIIFLATSLIAGGKPLLHVWINPELAEVSYPILVIHTLTFSIVAAVIIVWQLAEAFRLSAFNSITSFIWTAVAIPLMVLSSNRWSLAGIAMSRLIGVVITLPLLIIIERYCLGGSLWRFWVGVLLRSALAAGVTAALLRGYFYLIEPSYLLVFAGLVAGGAVYAATLLLSGFFTADEREMIRNFIYRR